MSGYYNVVRESQHGDCDVLVCSEECGYEQTEGDEWTHDCAGIKRACVVDRVAEWQDKVLRMGKVPRYTAWRSQILNGLVFPVQRGIDGLLMRKQPLKDFQRELIR